MPSMMMMTMGGFAAMLFCTVIVAILWSQQQRPQQQQQQQQQQTQPQSPTPSQQPQQQSPTLPTLSPEETVYPGGVPWNGDSMPGGSTPLINPAGGHAGSSTSRFVRQSNAPPKMFNHPKYGRIAGFSKKKWIDVAGLTEGNTQSWPKFEKGQFWDPYAVNGTEYDGGITLPVGVMPIVDPPKNRYNGPYWMRPTWQEGGPGVADLYRTKCASKVRRRGRLYYVGPTRGGVEGVGAGSYVWIVSSPTDPAYAFIPQPGLKASVKNNNDDVMEQLKNGHELPPWNRQGPHVAEQAIRSFCK